MSYREADGAVVEAAGLHRPGGQPGGRCGHGGKQLPSPTPGRRVFSQLFSYENNYYVGVLQT